MKGIAIGGEGEAGAVPGGKMSKKDKRAAKIAKQKEVASGTKEENIEQEDEEVKEDDNEDMGEAFGEENENDGGDPKTCIVAFKQVVIDILQKNELDQKRAAKMELLDFLNLLNLFNKQGIHFM